MAAPAQAADLYWNPTTGGSGTWDTTSTLWKNEWSSGPNTVWNNTYNDNAIFRGGVTGDITVHGGGISVQNITIGASDETANLYTFSSGTITLSGTTPNIIGVTNSTDNAIVNSVLSGTNLFFNNTTGPDWIDGISQSRGSGNLILTASNNLSGTVNVGGYNQGSGALRITNSGALGTATVEVNGQFCTTHLDLDGSGGNLTISNTIILHGRGNPHGSNLTQELVNVAGNNSITSGTSGLQIMSGGADFLIQSDSGKLTINCNIINNTGNSNARYFYLRGAGEGEVTGNVGINGTGTGPFYLIKTGSGTWTLSGSNSYSGDTTVDAGVLRLKNSHALPATSAAVIASGGGNTGRIELDGSSSPLTLSHTITLQGRSSTDYAHLANYYGPNTINGDISLVEGGQYYLIQSNANTLTLNNIKNNSTYTGTRNLNFSGAGNIVVNGVIGGSGSASNPNDISVIKSGSGTLTLSGTNTYQGDTTISAGILQLGGENLLPYGSGKGNVSLSSSSAILELNDYNVSINGLNGTAGSVRNSSGNIRTFTLGNDNVNCNYAGTIDGKVTLSKVGTGIQILTGTNTFTGPVNFNGGLINAATLNNLGNGSDLNFNSGGLQFNGVFDPSVRTMTFQAGGATLDTQTNNITLANPIGNDGPGGLRKLGAGTLTIAAATYWGDTTINDGMLKLGSDYAITYGGKVNLYSASAILEMNNYNAYFGGLNGTSGSVRNSGSDVMYLYLDVSNGNCNYAGTIEGNLELEKWGLDTQILSGSNTYTGGTEIYMGELQLGSDNPLPYGPGKGFGVRLDTWYQQFPVSILEMNGHTLNINGLWCSSEGIAGIVRNSGGSNTFTLGHNDADGVCDGGTIDGNLALVKVGAGVQILAGINTYNGATTISGGWLVVTNLNNGGTGSGIGSSSNDAGNLIIDGGALMYIGDVNSTTDRLFTLTQNGGALDASGEEYYGAGVVSFTNTGSVLFSGSGARELALYGTNTGNNTLAPSIGDGAGGSTSLAKDGPGTWLLTGTNTYTGGTIIYDGTLVAKKAMSLPGYNASGKVTVNAGATLAVRAGAATGEWAASEINTLQSSAVFNSGAFLGIDTTSDNFSYSNVIGGILGLTKQGTNTLMLTASNTYTGGTIINAGTLKLSGGDDRLATTGAITLNGGVLDLDFNTQHTSGIVNFQGGTVQNGTLVNTGTDYNFQAGTVSAILAGSVGVGLTKTTSGTLTLTASNSYIGATTISGGILEVGVLNNGGTPSGVGSSSHDAGNLIINGGTLRYSGTSNSTDRLFTVTENGGALDASGAGAVSLTSTGSVLSSGSGARTLTLAGTNTGNNTFATSIVDGTNGTTSLVKSGTGTWVLTGTSGYTGGTTISAGTLKLSSGNDRLSTTGAIMITGGILDLGGNSQYTSGVVIFGGVLGLGAKSQHPYGDTVFEGGIVQNGTYIVTGSDKYDGRSGWVLVDLQGDAGLTKTTTGILILSASNSYTGITKIKGGILSVSILADGGPNRNSGIGASSSDASNLVLNGGTLQYTGPAVSTNRAFQLGLNPLAGALDASGSGAVNWTYTGTMGFFGDDTIARALTLTGTNTGDNTLAAIIGNVCSDPDAKTSLVKSNIGKWVLSGFNTYSGGTTISGGVLSVGSDVNLGDPAGSVTFNGGKLAATSAVSMSRPITINATGGGIDTAGNVVEITGAQNTTWGAGTLTVDGANGGELKLNRTGGTVSVDPAAVLQINAGAKVELTGTPATKSGSNFLKIINNSLTSLLVSDTTAQEVGAITGTGTTEVAANATLIVSSISQTHISIGSHAKLIVRPSGSGPLSDGADLTSITPAPEPSTWAMLMLAAMGLGIYRHRRR